jgi:hypothetical protein
VTPAQLVPRARSRVQQVRKVFKVKPAQLALKARRVQLVQRARSQVQQVQLARKVFKVKPVQLALKVRKAFKA